MPIEALRKYWFVALLSVAAIVVLVSALVSFHNIVPIVFDGRTVLILGIAAVLILASTRVFFSDGGNVTSVRYVVAFDAVVFVILGMATTVLACGQWETAVLLAGSSLMIGGFVGLLFGYPQGVAQKAASLSANPGPQMPAAANANGQAANGADNPGQGPGQGAGPAPAPNAAPNAAPAHAQNLVAESAATLGKVITGFTLAKVDTMSGYFAQLTNLVGPALGSSSDSKAASVLAGVIITYFLSTGFLCGLFLPPYFMGDVL
jgi:hypothetical protein